MWDLGLKQPVDALSEPLAQMLGVNPRRLSIESIAALEAKEYVHWNRNDGDDPNPTPYSSILKTGAIDDSLGRKFEEEHEKKT